MQQPQQLKMHGSKMTQDVLMLMGKLTKTLWVQTVFLLI